MMLKLAVTLSLLMILQTTTAQIPEESPTTTDNPKLDVSANEVPISTSCVNARKRDGLCVERQLCDYGTTAIDFSLYSPKGFVRPCKPQEVCCPLESIVQQMEPTLEAKEKEFGFDADD